MTSVTSLFNKGIYKNTLRRFKWGSFIYFIMLFFAVPFTFMVQEPKDLQFNYNSDIIAYKGVLFTYGKFIFPMLMAMLVPSVVALLVYNYVHSSKHGIFVHSLPATRLTNYVSGIAAAFTLMVLPVVANGLILYILTFFGYSKLISFSSVSYWVWVNVFIIFVMFSVATFSSFLTGNSFAQVAINGIVHSVLPIISLTIMLLSEAFLYGYAHSHSSFAEAMIEYTPVVWIISAFSGTEKALKVFSNPAAWIYIAVAAVFYIGAALLYQKRRIESCGEVAGFKFMKPVLKYTVTSFVAVAAFGILINATIHWTLIIAVTALLCAITYFACEMILNKTLKVFKFYKGYFGFVGACAVVIVFCACTSVFGFETRIPDINDIENATMYTNYNENMPVSSEEASKEIVTKYHKMFIKNMPVLTSSYERRYTRAYERSQYINFMYTLKNGKTLNRRYLVENKLCDNAISEMFAFKDYKIKFSTLDTLNIENITNMELNINLPYFGYSFALNEDAKGLLKAIENDIETISYDEYIHTSPVNYNLTLSLSPEENDTQKAFKEHKNNERYYYHFDFKLNSNFKNAMNYLEDKGYISLANEKIANAMHISKNALEIAENEYIDAEELMYKDVISSKAIPAHVVDNCVKLETEDALKLLNLIYSDEEKYCGEEKRGINYIVFVCENPSGFYYDGHFATIPQNELPEFLFKYVSK